VQCEWLLSVAKACIVGLTEKLKTADRIYELRRPRESIMSCSLLSRGVFNTSAYQTRVRRKR